MSDIKVLKGQISVSNLAHKNSIKILQQLPNDL